MTQQHGATPTTATTLPIELAPTLREAAERLIAECGQAATPPESQHYGTERKCWLCHKQGKLHGHHLDDGAVVLVHAKCHVTIHRRAGR